VPGQGALDKVCIFKKKKKKSLPSVGPGALGKVMFFLKKGKTLPCVGPAALGKVMFFLKRKKLCRVMGLRHSAK
jgi:hypothetical protein